LKRTGLIVATMLLLAAGGCADGGGDPSTAARFKPGVTTRAEAVAQFGAPSSIFRHADGTTTLTWARGAGLFNPGETRGLSIVFSPDDRMVRVEP
jgi:hypothetical protein